MREFSWASLILVLGAIQLTATAQSHQEETWGENRKQMFPLNSDLEYEIISIQWPRLEKRTSKPGTGIQLKAFGTDIKLWLNPTDGILVSEDTPVYKASLSPSGIKFVENKSIIAKYANRLYEDRAQRASFVVKENSKGEKEIIGTVGAKNLTIVPLPAEFQSRISKPKEGHHYHVAFKTSNSQTQNIAEYFDSNKRSKRSIPDVLYPEILVVLAHDLYQRFWLMEDIAVPYLLAFWNAVDLKYRSLENPKFRLNIAGIVLPETEKALYYVSSNLYDATLLKQFETLFSSGTYWAYMKNRIPNNDHHDVIITMTSYTLCDRNHTTGKCDTGPLGGALNGGVCDTNGTPDLFKNVAIIHDSAGFDGIYAAAHELGHLLGAHHDGIPNTECDLREGFIMAPVPILNSNSSSWSKCSIQDILNKLSSANDSCLYNHPHQGKAMPRYLPGQMMNADHQCKKIEGTRACRIDASICRRLKCVYKADPKYCKATQGPAAEGTPCGDNKICLHSQCIEKTLIE